MTIIFRCRNRRCRRDFLLSAYEPHPAVTCAPGQVICPHCKAVSSADPAYIYLTHSMLDDEAEISFAEKKVA